MKKSLLKNVAGIFSTRIILLFTGFISSVLLSRTLGPNLKGIYNTINLSYSLVMTVFGIGFGVSLIYYLSKYYSYRRLFLGAALYLSFWWTPLLFGLSLLFFYLFRDNFFSEIPFPLFLFSLVNIPLTLLNQIFSAPLLSEKKFFPYNLTRVLSAFSFLFFYLLWWNLEKDLLWGAVISGILGELVYFILVFSFNQVLPLWPRGEKKKVLSKLLFWYGFKSNFSRMVNFFNTRFDFFMVKFYLSSSQLAFYSLAVFFTEMLGYLPGSIVVAIFPELSSLKEKKERKKLVKRILRWVLPLHLLILLVSYFVLPYLVKIFYGKKFLPVLQPFYYLLPGAFFLGLYRFLEIYFTSSNRVEKNIKFAGVMFGLNFILNLYLIPHFQLKGAAISTSLSYFVGLVLAWSSFRKFY